MFLAGIQAKLGLDPRFKHSGVTNSGHIIWWSTLFLIFDPLKLFSISDFEFRICNFYFSVLPQITASG